MKKESCHFIFVPADSSRTRRVRLSDAWVKGLSFGLVLIAGFSIFSMAGLVYYRNSYRNLVLERSRDQEFLKEKQALIAQVEQIRQNMDRTSQFASKLESAMGLSNSEIQSGIGPVSSFPPLEDHNRKEAAFVDFKMDQLRQDVSTLEGRLNKAHGRYKEKVVYLASTPSIWPTKGWLTSEFGVRRHPLHAGREMHEGIDISARWGSPISATADGIVTFAGYRGGLGKTVTIQHGFGVSTTYAHSSSLFVRSGQKVKRGDRISLVGSTGASTGPHVHYEVRVDHLPVNPMEFILE